ncbi:dTMP kinase [Leucothrix sargassi]|nr:dTMP kinase [Leucothrix sargassi]
MSNGLFLTFEGIEGAGKSSNVLYVKELLESAGKSVLVTREPGGTEVGEKIRHVLLDPELPAMHSDTELLLMFASRAEHYQHKILPALQTGQWVLCDRFTDASYAYQGGGRSIDVERIRSLEQWVLGDFKVDTTFLFDLPVDVGLSRAKARSAADRIEQEESEFFERIRQCYLDRAKAEPSRFEMIDAEQSIDDVKQQLDVIVSKLLSAQ